MKSHVNRLAVSTFMMGKTTLGFETLDTKSAKTLFGDSECDLGNVCNLKRSVRNMRKVCYSLADRFPFTTHSLFSKTGGVQSKVAGLNELLGVEVKGGNPGRTCYSVDETLFDVEKELDQGFLESLWCLQWTILFHQRMRWLRMDRITFKRETPKGCSKTETDGRSIVIDQRQGECSWILKGRCSREETCSFKLNRSKK